MEEATRFCIVWKAYFPSSTQQSSSSPAFLFQASSYKLHLNCNMQGNSYELILQQEDECEVLNTFDVSVMLQHEICDVVYGVGSNTTVQSNRQILGKFTRREIEKYLNYNPGCIKTGSVGGYFIKIVCIFFQNESQPSKKTRPSTESVSDFPPNLESLSLDIGSLLKNETFPDAKLRCGDRTIPVHRSVLAARSEVFAAMFRNQMKESKTGVVDIEDLDVPVVDLFLEYVYSGKISGAPDAALPGLYAAADKYAVHSLKGSCRDRMISTLTEENCTSFLTLADGHSDVALKKAVIIFVCNRKNVMKSEAWSNFSEQHPKLAIEVYQQYVQSKD